MYDNPVRDRAYFTASAGPATKFPHRFLHLFGDPQALLVHALNTLASNLPTRIFPQEYRICFDAADDCGC